jgi:hypothetical protein
MDFVCETTGNAAGRPVDARHAALIALDVIGTADAAPILQAVADAARGGGIRAAEILLSRIWPARKGRPVEIGLPAMRNPGGLVAALAAIGAGELAVEEAAAAAVLEVQRRAIETAGIEHRPASHGWNASIRVMAILPG